jgi:hypothetical protein
MPRKKLTARQKKARRKIVNKEAYLRTRHGTFENRLRDILYSARRRAKIAKIECAITISTFSSQTNCKALPHTMFKFDGTLKDKDQSMSIDKLDPTGGYTPDNTWLICHRANRIKNNATFEEFEMIYLNWKAELIRRGMKL